jgi:dynactin-6
MAEASKRVSTSSRTSGKRASTLPAAPRAPTSIDPSAVIANHAVLTGTYPITIGPRAVINPYCRISSTDGPVNIGLGAIIWEKAVVGSERESKPDIEERRCVLEANVVVETGAVVEADIVGEGTLVESYARVGERAKIGKVILHLSRNFWQVYRRRQNADRESSSARFHVMPGFPRILSCRTTLLSTGTINAG